MAKFYLVIRFSVMIVLLTGSLSAFAQKTVSGKVTSKEDGTPIPGVNVLEKGTSNGTATDADGSFTLNVGENAVLSFSFIGYTTQELSAATQSVFNVSLETDVTSLSEVVVVGYGQQEKKDVTGVVTAVDSRSFNKGAIVAPDQLIVGKVAGVQVVPVDGQPGSGSSIRIRGGTSIQASNEPLYVIDGFPIVSDGTAAGRNPLNFLNANDIETFTVLKDASAAAIYGSRAANGVIIITTKKGKSGAPSVTYDGYYSVGEVAKKYDVFDANQFRDLVTYYSPGSLKYLGDPNAENVANRAYNTNWQNEIFRSAVGQNHNITLSGGSDKTTYRVSVAHQEQNGVILTSYSNKTTFSTSISQSFLDDDLKIDINAKGALTADRFNPNVIGQAIQFDPTHPVYDATSPYGGYYEYRDAQGVAVQLATANPVSMLNQTQDVGQVFRGIGNIQADYKVRAVPGLRFNVNAGGDITRGQRNLFTPSTLKSAAFPDTGRVTVQHPYKYSKLLETYVNYTKDLTSINSKIDFTAGYTWQNFYKENPGFTSFQLSTNVYGVNNPVVAHKTLPFNPLITENRLISFFGRLNYAYKDKYLLTATVRRDGSTKFGPLKQWGTFTSAAFGWRIINEAFMASMQETFSDLKLRVGYGLTGNQDIGDYLYVPSYTPSDAQSSYPFGGQYYNSIRPSGYDNSLHWETTAATNIGLDFGVLNGRLTGSVEVYQKNTSDLLFTVAVAPGSNLTNTITSNIGKMRNRGLELTLNAIPVATGDLTWNLGFNIAFNQNKVTALDGNDTPGFAGYETGDISGGVGNKIQIIKTGQTLNSFRVLQHKNGPDGRPVADNPNVTPVATDMFVDQNGDNIINEKDYVIYKKPNPTAFMGLTSQLNYKNFDFSFTLRSNVGGYVYNNIASGATLQNFANTFRPINMPTEVLRTNYYRPQYRSDVYVENGSFLRMDNITLGYSVTQISKAKIRVYGTVQNAFLITKYHGIDPEVSINGIDNNYYPRARTFTVGIRVGI